MTPSTAGHFASQLEIVTSHVLGRDQALTTLPTLPSSEDISSALASLPKQLPLKGLGTADTINHLLESILPGILQAQNGPRYFGFVTGGVTPAAQLADILSGSYDENPGVTLHQESASTAIEQRTLEMVLDLLDIPRSTFMGRTLTSGATGSNILGLGISYFISFRI
jgi:glutamate/tyrosine decarboxylase-like PLP-dependent enzyme